MTRVGKDPKEMPENEAGSQAGLHAAATPQLANADPETIERAVAGFLAAEGSDWWGDRPESVRKLIAAGVVQFATGGYHATSTRDIARLAGMSPSGMYAHFSSKSDLLYEICRGGFAALLDELRRTFSSPADPRERFGNIVTAHVLWHAVHNVQARMANYELQFLPPEQLQHMRAMRKQLEEIVRESIWLTQGPSRTNVEGVQMVTRAVISLGIDVSRWYSPRSSLTPEELAEGYRRIALAMLSTA